MNSKTSKTNTTSNNKRKLLSMVTFFFSSLNILPIAFIFLPTHYLLINAWSFKLIWPITTSLCVSCTTMWKHFMSSLWMDIIDFIFRLLHISNLPSLVVLIPPCLAYTPFVECVHFSIDYVNSSIDCDNIFTNYTDFICSSIWK